MQSWIDGRAGASLALPDRGLEFGDGLFETMPIIRGHIPWLDYHLQRLRAGLERLGFPPASAGEARMHVLSALGDGSCENGVMRLSVTRGAGMRGYAPPPEARPTCIVQTWAVDGIGQPTLQPAVLQRCSIALAWQPALAGIKHLNRLEQVLAAQERQCVGADEMLMVDPAGNAVSVISGNLFIVRGGQLLTPALHRCGILGTRRRLLLETLAPALGLDCYETTLAEAELETADEAFFTNSLRGYQPIGRYRDRRWTASPITGRVQAIYREYLSACAA